MNLSEKDVEEIASLLECGEHCFVHQNTGEIEHYPDPNDVYFDPEPWQEVMDKVEDDWDNYLAFEPMDSRQGFKVMEDFAESLSDRHFQEKLFRLLSEHKPFSKFKRAVDYSDYRTEWFEFKKQANIKWVKEELAYHLG